MKNNKRQRKKKSIWNAPRSWKWTWRGVATHVLLFGIRFSFSRNKIGTWLCWSRLLCFFLVGSSASHFSQRERQRANGNHMVHWNVHIKDPNPNIFQSHCHWKSIKVNTHTHHPKWSDDYNELVCFEVSFQSVLNELCARERARPHARSMYMHVWEIWAAHLF